MIGRVSAPSILLFWALVISFQNLPHVDTHAPWCFEHVGRGNNQCANEKEEQPLLHPFFVIGLEKAWKADYVSGLYRLKNGMKMQRLRIHDGVD
jgi:hypothetical protein